MTSVPTDYRLIRELERIEARHWSVPYGRPGALTSHGAWIGGAFAGAIPEVDVLAMNRVIGLGLNGEVHSRHVDEIVSFYRNCGVRRFFVQLSPAVQSVHLRNLLADKGFRHYNNWAKLKGPAAALPPPRPGAFEVRPIGKEQAGIYGQLIFLSFGWEDSRLAGWFAESVSKPGFHHYLVYKGNKAVGAGALFASGTTGALAMAGMLPEFRGQGGQSLLLRSRIAQARASGCRLIVSETAEDTPAKPVVSYRNMLKHGLELAYLRENWIYEE